MAVSKKRKGAERRTGTSAAKVKKVLAKAKAEAEVDPNTKRWARKLHSSRMMFLKNDPDFLTMVKLGRAMNSISYCITTAVAFPEFKTNHTHLRQFRRSLVMLAGFVHEAIELVDSIKGRYLGVEEFEPLRQLVLGYDWQLTRKQAKKVRNYMAFHLDGYDEITRATIAKMKPTTYTFLCGEDQSYGSHYCEFADFIDMFYLGEVFPDDEDPCPPQEAGRRVLGYLLQYGTEFLKACHTFQSMLWEKRVKEHAY